MKFATSFGSLILVATLAVLTGCSSVPMAPKEQDAASKTFKAPSSGMAGIYIYRDSFLGKSLKKKLKIDDVVIGESANKVFFHKEVAAGSHKLSTESEFGDNVLQLDAAAGKNYYFRQYIKMGAFVGGSGLEALNEADGQQGVLQCNEAQ